MTTNISATFLNTTLETISSLLSNSTTPQEMTEETTELGANPDLGIVYIIGPSVAALLGLGILISFKYMRNSERNPISSEPNSVEAEESDHEFEPQLPHRNSVRDMVGLDENHFANTLVYPRPWTERVASNIGRIGNNISDTVRHILDRSPTPYHQQELYIP